MKLLNELELLSINQHYSSRTHCSHMLNPFKVLSHRQLNFMNVIANPLNRSPRDTQFCISSLLLFATPFEFGGHVLGYLFMSLFETSEKDTASAEDIGKLLTPTTSHSPRVQ